MRENRTRRSFLRKLGAALLGGAGISALQVAPASAATISVGPGQKVTCSSGYVCHFDDVHDTCPSGCCNKAFPCDIWRIYINFYGVTKYCSGTLYGPCGQHGYGRQCYGGPQSWMSHSFNKCCCGG